MRIASALSGISQGLQAIRTLFRFVGSAIGYTTAHWILAVLIHVGVAGVFE